MIFSLLLPVFLLPFEVFSLLCTFQNLHKVHLHVHIDCTITAEVTVAFDVAGESGDEVRVLYQLVDVADEGAAGHVAAGDLVDRDFLFGAGDSIQFSQKVCNSSLFEDDIDIIVASCVSSGIYIQTPAQNPDPPFLDDHPTPLHRYQFFYTFAV